MTSTVADADAASPHDKSTGREGQGRGGSPQEKETSDGNSEGLQDSSEEGNDDSLWTLGTASSLGGCSGQADSLRLSRKVPKLVVDDAPRLTRFIYASIVIANLGAISFKWLVAVSLRKLFIWVETEFSHGTSSLLDIDSSSFWRVIFIDGLDFFAVLGLSLAVAVPTAFCSTLLQALPVRLATATARARRERLLEVAIQGGVQASGKEAAASFILEQIAVLFEYEANTLYMRTAEMQCIGISIVFCLIVFWQGSLLSLLLFVIVVGAQTFQGYVLGPHEDDKTLIMGNLHKAILDVLRAADVVAMHNKESQEKSALRVEEVAAAKVDRVISRIMVLVGFPAFYVLTIGMPLVLLLAYGLFNSTSLLSEAVNTMFALLAMFFIFDEGHKSLNRLTLTAQLAANYGQAHKVVDEALFGPSSRPPKGAAQDGLVPAEKVEPGDLVFSHVSVQYADTFEPVLRDISFTISRGAKMGIVAESGAGKSTLFRAASGLVELKTGAIFFGGLALRPASRSAIRARMGFVSQDSVLFARSIRNNVWYGNDTPPDDAKIWQVLTEVGLDSWVSTRKLGLDTVLATERMVSGGQAQRLQIARLLCRENLHYALLDECMSALDPTMRSLVTHALRAFLGDMTALIITHSHDTVVDLCDEVLDLSKLQARQSDAIMPVRKYIASSISVRHSIDSCASPVA